MIAVITFQIRDLIHGVQAKGISYYGKCNAEFIDSSEAPIQGDVSFLNRFPAEISIHPAEDGKLNHTFMQAGLDEQVAAWRQDGYPSTEDATLIRYWPKNRDSSELLAIGCAMTDFNFRYFHSFMAPNFGRPDLIGRMAMSFYGFSEPPQPNPTLPTKKEFLAGRPYFMVNPYTLTFSATPLP